MCILDILPFIALLFRIIVVSRRMWHVYSVCVLKFYVHEIKVEIEGLAVQAFSKGNKIIYFYRQLYNFRSHLQHIPSASSKNVKLQDWIEESGCGNEKDSSINPNSPRWIELIKMPLKYIFSSKILNGEIFVSKLSMYMTFV